MIYYFSSTGNSKYVVQRLAEALDETHCDMANTVWTSDKCAFNDIHMPLLHIELFGVFTMTA